MRAPDAIILSGSGVESKSSLCTLNQHLPLLSQFHFYHQGDLCSRCHLPLSSALRAAVSLRSLSVKGFITAPPKTKNCTAFIDFCELWRRRIFVICSMSPTIQWNQTGNNRNSDLRCCSDTLVELELAEQFHWIQFQGSADVALFVSFGCRGFYKV